MLQISRRLVIHQIRYFCHQPAIAAIPLSSKLYEYLNGNGRNQENQRNIFSKLKNNSNELDNNLKRELKATSFNSSKIFQLLDDMYQIDVHQQMQLQKLKFFRDALSILESNIGRSFVKSDYIKLVFFATFYKKHDPGPRIMKNLFESFLDKALSADLTTQDLAILCLASYKTSVRIQNEKFHQRVIDEVIATSEDDFLYLVTFLKSLRFNRIKDEKVLDKLKLLNCEKHNFQTLIHVLPYIADNGINEPSLSERIVKRCIETFDSKSRVKDIQKMLHSCAMLNLSIDSKHLEVLEDMIVTATNNEEYKKFFDHYVNSALSFWILNFHCLNLAKILLKDGRFYASGPYSRIKLDSRMKLLKTCIEIERPELIKNIKYHPFDETRPSPGYLIKPSLEKVMNTHFKNHKNVTFVHQIKYLNIAGILVINEDGSRTHYEVLDELTSLADKTTPNGLFELKLRLLKRMCCNVEVINSQLIM